MKEMNFSRFAELVKQTTDNLITDLGIWVNNLVAKLNGEPAPQYAQTVQRRTRSSAGESTEAAAPHRAAEEAEVPEDDFLTAERQDIAEWLKKTRFRTKFFMGADEVDVWKKIGQLNRLYDKALLAERARYDALLRQYMDTVKTQQECRSYKEECEVEDEYSGKGEQLPAREDNSEKTAECSNEVRVSQPADESGSYSTDNISDTVADVPDNAGTGEQYVPVDKGRRPDDRLQVRARVRKG